MGRSVVVMGWRHRSGLFYFSASPRVINVLMNDEMRTVTQKATLDVPPVSVALRLQACRKFFKPCLESLSYKSITQRTWMQRKCVI